MSEFKKGDKVKVKYEFFKHRVFVITYINHGLILLDHVWKVNKEAMEKV